MKILKYVILMQNNFVLSLPKNACILPSIHNSQNTPYIFALVDVSNENEYENRFFSVFSDEQEFNYPDDSEYKYIGTTQIVTPMTPMPMFFHLFEKIVKI
jgi:hypothetical protein